MGKVSWKRLHPQPDIISAFGEVGWGSDRKMTGAGGWGHGQQKSPQMEGSNYRPSWVGSWMEAPAIERHMKTRGNSNALQIGWELMGTQ